jgi:two-component system, NtrC family, response regulator AtoC
MDSVSAVKKDCRIIVVDDEEVILDSIRDYFDEYTIITHSDPRAALDDMRRASSDVLVCDFRMPHLSGLDLFREAKSINAYRYGILLTAYADKDLLLASIQERLVDRVVEKPLRMDLLEDSLRDAVFDCRMGEAERVELAAVKRMYREKFKGGASLTGDIVGLEGSLAAVYRTLRMASATRESILFTGETGTGKEVAARLAHSLSAYASGPFMKLNCGAIPEALIESELFGHAKGAFSGAASDREGKVELADGGTLFLDEIGELGEAMQTRFLQVLEEKTVERVGSNKRRRIDFRLMCATNRDLDADIASGRFRKDLYFRIETIKVELPPLRERPGDIPAFALSILDAYCAELGRPRLRLSSEALDQLASYSWPGNVRELENVLKRAVVLSDPRAAVLPARALTFLSDRALAKAPSLVLHEERRESTLDQVVSSIGDLMLAGGASLEAIEDRLLGSLLDRHGGNVLETSRRSGIPKDRLYRHLKRTGREA